MKTTIQSLIDSLKEIGERKLELTNKGIVFMLENCLNEEREQIIKAFEEGVKYGNSLLQTFDYPASRYYSSTYKNSKKKK